MLLDASRCCWRPKGYITSADDGDQGGGDGKQDGEVSESRSFIGCRLGGRWGGRIGPPGWSLERGEVDAGGDGADRRHRSASAMAMLTWLWKAWVDSSCSISPRCTAVGAGTEAERELVLVALPIVGGHGRLRDVEALGVHDEDFGEHAGALFLDLVRKSEASLASVASISGLVSAVTSARHCVSSSSILRLVIAGGWRRSAPRSPRPPPGSGDVAQLALASAVSGSANSLSTATDKVGAAQASTVTLASSRPRVNFGAVIL